LTCRAAEVGTAFKPRSNEANNFIKED